MIELPELPKADGYGVLGIEQCALYSADQLRSYGLSCARAAMERAAQISENSHPHDWAFIASAIRSELSKISEFIDKG